MNVFLLCLLAVISPFNDGASLTGKVQDANGQPIANATVDIYTAKPRVGAATTCPSCYRDCAKLTTTNAKGQFEFNQLNSNLLFRVLVMAPGQRSQLTPLTDPAAGDVVVQLEPVPEDLPNDRKLTGTVVDNQGKPVAGATVWPIGAQTSKKRWWGQIDGVDEASITDGNGKFVITSQSALLGLDVRVKAAGFANLPAQHLKLADRIHELRLELGASVSGKLTFNGQPVANRSIGIVQRDRGPEEFVGEQVIMTDDNGYFQFTDLQPKQSYAVYSLCEPNDTTVAGQLPVKDLPILKTRSIETASSGGLTELGELQLVQGQTFSGRITVPAPDELPATVKIRLDRQPAWDWIEVTPGSDGEFIFQDLPAEVYSVSINAPGFEIDPSGFKYQLTGKSQFGMRLRDQAGPQAKVVIPLRAKKQ